MSFQRGCRADMNLKQLLEVIQVQRHDFLNHLQVISGLLQLNRANQARDYIARVVLEVGRMSKTTRVSVPEITAALLVGFNEAYKKQVNFNLTVQADFAGCAVPGPVVGEAMESCLVAVLCCLSGPGIRNGQMEILLGESGNDYFCQVVFCQPAVEDYFHLENRLEPVKMRLTSYGGKMNMAMIGDRRVEISLVFPRRV